MKKQFKAVIKKTIRYDDSFHLYKIQKKYF